MFRRPDQCLLCAALLLVVARAVAQEPAPLGLAQPGEFPIAVGLEQHVVDVVGFMAGFPDRPVDPSRRAVVAKLFESLGGRIEAFYYAFGDTDLFIIADMPDNASMAAAALTAVAGGGVTVTTTVLMSPEELDEAAKKTPTYRPPGQ